MRLKGGNIHIQSATTTSVPHPPITTAGTVPNSPALIPARNSPSSFDAPTKSEFNEPTRPRILSGVAS